ncbi:hypothetical protein [Hydrogenispora ethanolica]|uniref:hypothetical protein n=1 Tax=Hydrogenispora ethanolica TaxID=1082276 RepID=UPI0014045EBD|nr:hypothetical protein [Hydrogenispora ethanolica]
MIAATAALTAGDHLVDPGMICLGLPLAEMALGRYKIKIKHIRKVIGNLSRFMYNINGK